MNSEERKKVSVISKYVIDSFNEGDWLTLGQITGKVNQITGHGRLLRSLGFGDDDYSFCVAEVLDSIFSDDSSLILDVVDHFDIDLWYQQKHPEKYQRVFGGAKVTIADFWAEGHIKLFVSHLSSNRSRMSALKASLSNWGICAFIAHEDIEASREWRDEVEAGLETMDILAAVVEPGFKESDWCAQEVGYALGRKIDIIPLRAGLDPFGFFGKYQGIPIKGKIPDQVANEIANLLLKKPKHREQCLKSLGKALLSQDSAKKISMIDQLDEWAVTTDEQLKRLLESASLSEHEQNKLHNIVTKVGAYKPVPVVPANSQFDDEIPF
jgi:serine/threonine protein kinase